MLKEQYPNLYERYEQKGQLNDQRAAFFFLCRQVEKDNKRTLNQRRYYRDGTPKPSAFALVTYVSLRTRLKKIIAGQGQQLLPSTANSNTDLHEQSVAKRKHQDLTHIEMRMQAALLQSDWQDDDEGRLQDITRLPSIQKRYLRQSFQRDYESSYVQTTTK